MTERTTFSIEDDNFAFLFASGGKNKRAYINELIRREKPKALEEAIIKANEDSAKDPDCIEDIQAFGVTLLDGLKD